MQGASKLFIYVTNAVIKWQLSSPTHQPPVVFRRWCAPIPLRRRWSLALHLICLRTEVGQLCKSEFNEELRVTYPNEMLRLANIYTYAFVLRHVLTSHITRTHCTVTTSGGTHFPPRCILARYVNKSSFPPAYDRRVRDRWADGDDSGCSSRPQSICELIRA